MPQPQSYDIDRRSREQPRKWPGLQLDAHTLQKLKEQALRKAKLLQLKAARATSENLDKAKLAAHDVASSKNAHEAGSKVWTLWRHAERGSSVTALARMLVCLYFVNLVLEDYENYNFWHTPDMVERRNMYPHRFPPIRYPYLGIYIFVPCAVLAALGIWVPATASVMTLDMLWNSSELIWSQMLLLVRHGQRPNELVVKKLSMLGCVALVLAHSVKDMQDKLRGYHAGLLYVGDDKKEPGVKKSLLLLAGRLLITGLFVYVGWVQMYRVAMRDWALWSKLEYDSMWRKDGHDNNWLLMEFAMALPFAVGFKTAAVSRLLALTLVLEALTCWPIWTEWPSVQYKSHVRLHFVTNLGVAGGLVLLQSFGAGRYTVDRLMQKKGE
ncbi:hypothetical protein CVIRNUC_003790 [Coccomyxa viridis]|uniref:HTTM domain-containing protein n=1 Tax=Coccomyxa viridis TaxID=1274662 RepID=A0AAV1I2L8_9CHLO|nr:hypothetical protein CVIRNUC_003790 [Coccomyxa viridis]